MTETAIIPAAGDDAPRGGEALTFSTTIRPKAFLGLSLKNGLLNIITLTLYRFWGKTEVRRRVWRGVRINGDALEYTGRGKELFFGFLIALVVLGLPFLLVVFGAQLMGPVASAMILPPLYIFFGWLWGFGVFNAFRYMASRTTWRGLRFRLGDGAVTYGWKYLGYLILSGFTFGWFWPQARRNLAEALWSKLRFGTLRFDYSVVRAHRVGVYGWFALGWFGTVVGYFVFFGMIMAVAMGAAHLAGGAPSPGDASLFALAAPTPPRAPDFLFIAGVYGVLLLVAPLWFLLWAPFEAALLRSITAGVGLDGARFQLDVKALPLWWLTVSNLFLILITLGFLMPWAQARTVRFMIERLRSTGEARLELAQQAREGPSTGEGLADAFGFSMI